MGLLQENFRQAKVLQVLGEIKLNSDPGPISFQEIQEKLKAEMDARKRDAADVDPDYFFPTITRFCRKLGLEFAKYTTPQTDDELGETLRGLQDRCVVVQGNRNVELKETTWIFGRRIYSMPCNTAE